MKVEVIAWSQGPNLDGVQIQPEEIAEVCGRTCYKSPQKTEDARTKFLQNIIKCGHESVIEHCTITMRFTGVSRALTHQLVRHRLFSFSQQSQRYVKENEPEYVTPPIINREFTPDQILDNSNNEAKLSAAKAIYDDFMKQCWFVYNNLVELGMKKEDARYVLPNAAYTEIVVTGNFREWRHFINLRADIHAQHEIRHLAHLVNEKLMDVAPAIFGDLVEKFKDTDCEI